MADTFHAKVSALRPTGAEGHLVPGAVFIAVLKHDKKPTDILLQSDVVWMRCPESRKLAAAFTAYKKLSGCVEDLIFQHDFKMVAGTELVSRLNWRRDSVVVLEAVAASDAAARAIGAAAERVPLRSIDTNTATVPQTLKPDQEERKLILPEPEIIRHQSMQDIPTQEHLVQPDEAVQQAENILQPRAVNDSGWIDFALERRAFLQKTTPLNMAAEGAHMDASARMEWASMQQQGREFFAARALQIGPTTGNWIPDRYAFWHHYYNRIDEVRRNLGPDPHRSFISTQVFLTSMVREWAMVSAQTKGTKTQQAEGFIRQFPLSEPPMTTHEPATTPFNVVCARSDPSTANKMTPEAEAASRTDELPPEVRLNISDLFADSPAELLEVGVEKGISILDELKTTLQTQSATSLDAAQWLQSIENVRNQAIKTKTIIGVVGQTGAGKSSVINALLDEERLVPTNCMRACTAVVCEISYNYEDIPYRAEIEFISVEDWYKELKTLFQDLLDHDGKVSRESTNEESHAGVAYAKIKSVYPRLTKEDMQTTTPEHLMAHENVKCLGSLRKLEDEDSSTFYKKLQSYVDSKEKAGTKSADKSEKKRKGPREMEYWPLIKVVRIYTKAAALSTGAVLVDLPGVHDSNQARAAVAQGYIKQCNGLWIVAPITRAVDDKSAKNLLGDTFKRQLKMDGGYSSVTFICSKTDDISLMEATASLGLEDEIGDLWTKIDAYDKDTREMEKTLEGHKNSRTDVCAVMDQAEEDLEVWEKLRDDLQGGTKAYAPKTKSAKRKRNADTSFSRKKSRMDDSDNDFVDDDSDSVDDEENEASDSDGNSEDEARSPLTENEAVAKISELKAIRKNGRQERAKLGEDIKNIKNQIKVIQEQSNVIAATIAEHCISGRNNYSRDAIRQDFAAGIKDLDQELSEQMDAANFDPEKDARDYDEVAKSLPVYCVSSRGYQKLMGRLKKDANVPGFKDVVETEIPQLQAHCQKLTEAGREGACRRFLNSLSQLLNSLRLWSSSDGVGRMLSEGQLKRESLWLEDRLNRFDKSLERQVKQICNQLSEEVQDSILESFEVAAKSAATEAIQTVQHWGQKIDRENRAAGGLYWATYKAVCRRDGVFRDIDFNGQLTEPIIKHVSNGWEKAFQRRLPSVLTRLPTVIGDIVQNAHQDIEAHCTRGGSSAASFNILQQSIPAYKEIFKDAANIARVTLTERQRDINREFTPVITEYMLDAYADCVAEHGTGSYMRMKNLMARHVDTHRHKMFTESTAKVESLLEKLIEDTEKLLLAKADEVFHSIKRDYTRVVVGRDNTDAKQLPCEQRQMKRNVLEILEGSELQFKHILEDSAAKSDEIDREESVDKGESNAKMLQNAIAAGTETATAEGAALVSETESLPSRPHGVDIKQDEVMHDTRTTLESGNRTEEDHNRPERVEAGSQEGDTSASQCSKHDTGPESS